MFDFAAILTAAAPPETGGTPEWVTRAMFIAGLVLILVFLLRAIRNRLRRSDEQAPPRERLHRVKAEAAARDEVHSVLAEAVDVSTRLCAQIDARAEALERLIRHADERLDLLERRQAGEMPEDPEAGEATPAPAAVPAPAPPRARVTTSPPPDPLSAEIHRLADEGLPPIEIAHQLDEQVGKVELILALRQR